jgi:hypothetical protein
LVGGWVERRKGRVSRRGAGSAEKEEGNEQKEGERILNAQFTIFNGRAGMEGLD